MRHFSPQPTADEIEFGHVFRTLWRGKFWIILMAMLGALLGGWYAYGIATPLYSASADVTFEHRQEKIVELDTIVGSLSNDQVTLNTEIEVLRSRLMLGRVVEKLALTQDPEFNEYLRGASGFGPGAIIAFLRGLVSDTGTPVSMPGAARVADATVDELSRAISISNVRQSYVFRIRVTTREAEKSARIANALAELYIGDQLEQKFEATERATQWLSERVAALQEELEADLVAVKEFSADSAVIGPAQLEVLSRQIKDLRARRESAQQEANSSALKLAEVKAAVALGDFHTLQQITKDTELHNLLTPSGALSDPRVMDRANAILRAQQQHLERAEGRVQVYETSIAQLDGELTAQSEELVQLQQLEREAEASRLIYEYFLGRLKETSVQQGIQQADSRVLSHAVVPLDPAAPRKLMILALTFILGGFAGIAWVLGREITQNTIRKAEDLEQLTGLSVMGQIPEMPVSRRRSPVQYLLDKPASAAAEAIRNLRTSTLLSNMKTPPQVIMITSSVPGEGKTRQSLALAQNFASLGKRTLVMECDLRRRVFARHFDAKGAKGIMSVLAGKMPLADAVLRSDLLGCDVLIAEEGPANAADVFSSTSFAELMQVAREAYECIIIDTPPVLVVPDARVIGQRSDAILYAVKWDSTTTRQVVEGLKSFSSVGLKVTGTFLTQINIQRLMRYGLGDGYGAYGKYGRGYYEN